MRLVGDDLDLISYEYVKDIVGNGTDVLRSDDTIVFPAFFIIKEVVADEIFLNNHKKGDFYYSLNGSEILSEGTVFEYIKENEYLADIKSFSMQLSYKEIDVTTIDDDVTKYVKSIQECSGNIGFQVLSEKINNNSIINRFIKIAYVDDLGVNKLSNIDNKEIYIRGYVNKLDTINQKILLFAKIELFDYNITGNMGVAQEFSSSFKLKDIDPLLFVISEEQNG